MRVHVCGPIEPCDSWGYCNQFTMSLTLDKCNFMASVAAANMYKTAAEISAHNDKSQCTCEKNSVNRKTRNMYVNFPMFK